MPVCGDVIEGEAPWTVLQTGTETTTVTFVLPANAAAGVVVCSSVPVGRGDDGTQFTVKADGVTVETTPCIVAGSADPAAIPRGTAVITVEVANGCVAGDDAEWTIEGASS